MPAVPEAFHRRIPMPTPAAAASHPFVVIGGGLAGLAAAEAILEAVPGRQVVVVESGTRPGGVLDTVERDGWLVERSADCFLAARPEGIALAERLGLSGALVGVEPRVRRALVYRAGRCLPAPAGFRLLAPGRVGGILRSPLLSPFGRLRMLAERFVPPRRGAEDESLESFAVRRLGREAFERLVQPLAAGIWTADPARLSMAAACAEFAAMERERGSLWAGERARLRTAGGVGTAAGARYGQFVSFTAGMATLPRRLAERIIDRGGRFLAGRVSGVRRGSSGWVVGVEPTAGPAGDVEAAGVVVAVPAPSAATILAGLDRELADDLAGIAYAGSAIVSLGFARADVAHPLDAAGVVVPRREGRRILAVSFSSEKFPGRAPAGCVLLRIFLGGALDPGVLELDDEALAALAGREAAAILGITGRPRLVQVDRWAGAMPQYHVGHVDRVGRIESALAAHAGLALAGAAYRGVGIPQVIASGQAAARAITGCVST